MASEGKKIKLNIGERYAFSKDDSYCRILSGNADVYASTKSGRQHLFLLKRKEGEGIFGLCDESSAINITILAHEPMELVMADWKEDVKAFRDNLRGWFKDLLQIEWLAFFANHNDELVSQWGKKDFLEVVPEEKLLDIFHQHQEILTMLCSGQFFSRDVYFKERLAKRSANSQRLIREALELFAESEYTGSGKYDFSDSDISNLVKRVLKFYRMEDKDISAPDYIKGMYKGDEILKYYLTRGNLRYRKVLLNTPWWNKDSGVLFIQYQKEWCLALPERSNSYRIYCPNGRFFKFERSMMTDVELDAFAIYPGLPEKKITWKDLVSFIWKTMWIEDWYTILITSFFIGLIPLLTPVITKTIFADVIPIHDYSALSTITQVMFVSAVTLALITIVRSVAVIRIVAGSGAYLETALWSRLLKLPVSFFKNHSVGELAQRMMNFCSAKNFFTGQFISGIFNAVFGIWSLAIMFYFSTKLALWAVLIWGGYLLLQFFIFRKYPKYEKELLEQQSVNSGKVVELLNSIGKFRSRGGTEHAYFMWSKVFKEKWNTTLKIRWLNNYSMLATATVNMVLMLVMFVMAVRVMGETNSNFSITEFLAFSSAYTAFGAALLELIPNLVQASTLPSYIENISPILDEATETKADLKEAGRLTGEVELKHIAFGYDDGPELFRDINMQISPGEVIAIVGPSGCGKSTLVRLMLGFEKPTQGLVLYDGLDLQEADAGSVRRQMGVVMQNGKLLCGSILENILGSSNLTIDDAWDAARKAGIADDIEDMPMGMHTIINDTSDNISGGQRQRILLARSIVNKPKILILDEATSALDNTTQTIVTESLSAMKCTQIIVAHRLSTIKKADKIFVLNKGRIEEQGSYDELMANDGLFAQLARRQLA